jgi:hypothetical protein
VTRPIIGCTCLRNAGRSTGPTCLVNYPTLSEQSSSHRRFRRSYLNLISRCGRAAVHGAFSSVTRAATTTKPSRSAIGWPRTVGTTFSSTSTRARHRRRPALEGSLTAGRTTNALIHAPPARLMGRGETMPTVLPESIADHPTAQRLARQPNRQKRSGSVKKHRLYRGTESSNPSPSSRESANFTLMRARDLEGIVAKRLNDPYKSQVTWFKLIAGIAGAIPRHLMNQRRMRN